MKKSNAIVNSSSCGKKVFYCGCLVACNCMTGGVPTVYKSA